MLERVGCHLKKSSRKNLLVVAEARGKKEDDALRAAFDDLRNGRV